MDLGLNRRNAGRLVLLAWAVALAWLARRELARSNTSIAAERATRIAPGARFYILSARGRQVGQVNITLDTLIEGSRLTELWVADQPAGDSIRQVASSGEFLVSRSFLLRSYDRKVFGVGLPDELEVTLGTDSTLGLRETEGERLVAAGRRRADPGAILPAMLPFRAALGGFLRVGTNFRLEVLDPESGHTRLVRVRVTAESTFVVSDSAAWDSAGGRWKAATKEVLQGWRLEHDARGVPTVDWVDRGGGLIVEEMAGGVRLERAPFEVVRNNYNAVRRAESAAWRRTIPGMAPARPLAAATDEGVPLRRYLVQPDSGTRWSAADWSRSLAGGRQEVIGDTLAVRRDTPPDSAGRALPAPEEWSDWLPMEASVQRASTTALAGLPDTAPAMERARRLTAWVARQVATDSTPSATGAAITTLLFGRGSPDGKAALLVAMARAAGMPARRVAGLAILPEGAGTQAWAEIWTGAWTAADPLSGQLPASPLLVRLATGKRSRLMDLLPVAGSARFLPLEPIP
jgi:transglutaminase-like putative cysteine protease